MPQEHYILRCFSCETFQVHIVKKAKKWECKVCGAKQSVVRNYGKGNAKDCRNHVMKLNVIRLQRVNNSEGGEFFDGTLTEEINDQHTAEKKSFTSKWTEYIDENKTDGENDNEDDELFFNNKIIDKGPRNKKISKKKTDKRKRTYKEFDASEVSPEANRDLNQLKLNNKKVKVVNENTNDADLTVNSEIGAKTNHGKYSKYLDMEESDETLLGRGYKNSNIFDCDLSELDNLLNI